MGQLRQKFRCHFIDLDTDEKGTYKVLAYGPSHANQMTRDQFPGQRLKFLKTKRCA